MKRVGSASATARSAKRAVRAPKCSRGAAFAGSLAYVVPAGVESAASAGR